MKNISIMIFLLELLTIGCYNESNESIENSGKNVTPVIEYTFINSYPHDVNSFTDGLLFHNGILYESTGATANFPQTKSLFGKVDLKIGKINTFVEIDMNKYFGEGITILQGKVYQLTYRNKIGFVYDTITFKKIRDFSIPGNEGWGLTNDGTNLIMSDGTNFISYLNPDSLKVIKRISVTKNGSVQDNLNELEYINGYLYANIWTSNTIVKIEPGTGKIVGILDLTVLAEEAKEIHSGSAEMNGIAWDSITDRIMVTGKLWPKLYEINYNH